MQQRTAWSPVPPNGSLLAFLARYLGSVEREDVGPLIGQAALLSEHGPLAIVVPASAQAELNSALAGAASRLEPDSAPMRSAPKRLPKRRLAFPLHPSRPGRSRRAGPFTR